MRAGNHHLFDKGYVPLTGGSLLALRLAEKHQKPVLHVDLNTVSRQESVGVTVSWLGSDCPDACVLNVAGSRESKAHGIGRAVEVRMIDVISKANGKLFYPVREEGCCLTGSQNGGSGA